MTGAAIPVDSFHFVSSKGNAFMDYILDLDAKERKPFFDMLTRLRLGDRALMKAVSPQGRPQRMGLIEVGDARAGHRIYGVMNGNDLVILGAGGKGNQDCDIQKAIESKREFEQLKASGKLDLRQHTKFHFHPALPQGHMTLGGKHAAEFADRHGRPIEHAVKPAHSFNNRAGRLAVAVGTLAVSLLTGAMPDETKAAVRTQPSPAGTDVSEIAPARPAQSLAQNRLP